LEVPELIIYSLGSYQPLRIPSYGNYKDNTFYNQNF